MTPLKHTLPLQSGLYGILLCYNHSPWTPLKHTLPLQSGLCGIAVCFNAREVPLLPRFGS